MFILKHNDVNKDYWWDHEPVTVLISNKIVVYFTKTS